MDMDLPELHSGQGITRVKSAQHVEAITENRPFLVYENQISVLARTNQPSYCNTKGCKAKVSITSQVVGSALYLHWVSKYVTNALLAVCK